MGGGTTAQLFSLTSKVNQNELLALACVYTYFIYANMMNK